MEGAPLVSIIMPAYNVGGSLISSVGSVLSQSYHNIELVLVDDGSSDDTPALCDSFARTDPRVVVIHQPNAGVSSARNAGIARATGEYLVFVDADDHLDNEALAITVPLLDRDSLDIACFGMTFVYHDGLRVSKRRDFSVQNLILLDSAELIRERFFELYELNYWQSACAKVFRTSFIRSHSLTFDAQLAILEDFEFVVRSLTHVPRLRIVPEPLYDYNIDLSVDPASRRPDIDYRRNFRRLEESLESMAQALHIDSPTEQTRLRTLTFHFYTLGLQMLFSRPLPNRERYRTIQAYLADESVLNAATGVVTPHWNLALAARYGASRRALPLFFLLGMNHWGRYGKRTVKYQIARARSALRDLIQCHCGLTQLL